MQKISKFKHCFIRENTYDKAIVNEVLRTYQWMLPKNEVVLDIGACFLDVTKKRSSARYWCVFWCLLSFSTKSRS